MRGLPTERVLRSTTQRQSVKRVSTGTAGSCALLVAGAVFGCAGDKGSDADDSHSAAGGRVCEGNHFIGDEATQAAVADCTVVRGDLIFTGNLLVNAELPKLAQVDGSFSVWGNPNLTHVDMPLLKRVGGYFLIDANDTLTSVDLPLLENVNERALVHLADFSISGNPKLPTCQAHAIRDHLRAKGFDGSVKVADNLGTCPP